MDMTEYKKRIKRVQEICLEYGLRPEFGNHGSTKDEIDYRYDSKFIKNCGEIIRIWPDSNTYQYVVLFNELLPNGDCYEFNEKILSEGLKEKILKKRKKISNSFDMEDLYEYGEELIRETILHAINDMKKFDMQYSLDRLKSDFE